jgi:hypothetical protein
MALVEVAGEPPARSGSLPIGGAVEALRPTSEARAWLLERGAARNHAESILPRERELLGGERDAAEERAVAAEAAGAAESGELVVHVAQKRTPTCPWAEKEPYVLATAGYSGIPSAFSGDARVKPGSKMAPASAPTKMGPMVTSATSAGST